MTESGVASVCAGSVHSAFTHCPSFKPWLGGQSVSAWQTKARHSAGVSGTPPGTTSQMPTSLPVCVSVNAVLPACASCPAVWLSVHSPLRWHLALNSRPSVSSRRRSLTLLQPPAHNTKSAHSALTQKPRPEIAPIKARAAWLGAALFSRVRARTDLRERTQEMVGAYRCSHWRETLRTVWERPTAKSLLADIRCRTLVLVGEADSPEFKAMANAYAQGIPGATLVEMEGVGHMGPMEAPERFNRLLGDFIEADEAAMPVLPSSTRLEFRTWQRDNLPLGMQLWGDAQVTAFITARPFTPLQVEERVRQEVLGQATYGMQYGPVFLRSSGELVGCCGFRPRPATPGTLELGFLLRPQFWGLGLATEAARAAVEHGFGALDATAVFAGHHPENLGSRRVLEKLGFRRTHLEHYPPTGLDHPSYLLTREAFFSEPPSP